jgi:hypothetical protein
MKPFSPTQQTRIANNIVAACRDISKLNGPAYRFISGCPGFIAHYDINGFKAHFDDKWGHYCDNNLRADILEYQRFNQWGNFHPGETWYEYYMSRKAIYNAICKAIKQLENVTC